MICALLASAGITGCASAPYYKHRSYNANNGVVVGTVYERAAFVPYGTTFVLMDDKGNRYQLNRIRIKGFAFQEMRPTGAGTTFALELPPGSYKVVQWWLDYGSMDKKSETIPDNASFVVEAGKFSYIGRLDANRFMEVASIRDNFDEDLPRLKRHADLAKHEIVNQSMTLQGWWLPDPTGKRMGFEAPK
ncbi:MAG: hypothetical protein E6Q76_11240 [Rhizobium sp.]|nr:MAG: hypothetical protein E6Q76_11240 [Rhizobium sp.]